MPNIFIEDELNPEASAMLQALYSRSCSSAKSHIHKVKENGSAKFMESYYVGYGHASIGDCGTTTIFIEGLSTLACKAIQDNPLYSGQESSTRYIDFTKQGYFDPVNTRQSKEIIDEWLLFYENSQQAVFDHLNAIFSKPSDVSESVWKKTLDARKFDILRGFLPVAVKTQLAWTTNLRQAADKLKLLRYHPTLEVRTIAEETLATLQKKYPSSFGHKKYSEQEEYLLLTSKKTNYLYQAAETKLNEFSYTTTINNKELEAESLLEITARPKKTELPRYLGKHGTYKCKFMLDFGSFRDLQRHRNGICQIPLITEQFGFHSWYTDQLPACLKEKAEKLIQKQYTRIKAMKEKNGTTAEELQYFFPLGANLLCETTYDLPQMVYVTELRADKTVHPTLRAVVHQFHHALTKQHPKLKLYTDLDADSLDSRRGTQDIVKKN